MHFLYQRVASRQSFNEFLSEIPYKENIMTLTFSKSCEMLALVFNHEW